MMPFTPLPASFRLTYTEPMVRDAVWTYVRRRLIGETRASWVVAALLAILLAGMVVNGDRSWLVGALAAAVAAPFLLVAVGWRAHFANTVGRFRSMREPVAEVRMSEDGLSFASELGTSDLKWPGFTEAWERPGYWMLFTGRNQFNVLPTGTIPPERLAWLRGKIPAAEKHAPRC